MNPEEKISPDSRVNEILDLIMEAASGNFNVKGTVSPSGDELDGIICGLNMLVDELSFRETALKKSEELYRSLVENIDLRITMISSDYKIVMTNTAQSNVLGKPACELVGKNCFEEFEKREAVCPHCPGTKAMATGRPAEAETVWGLDDGRKFSVRVQAFPLMSSEGSSTGFIEVIEDITERKQMEEELGKTQHLRALGTLAGGLAHDFNNMLTAIIANISLVKTFGDLERDISEYLNDAESASLRARDLTQQLLTFATGGTPIKKSLWISELVRETAQFSLSGSNVKAEYELPADLWAVEADEGQIGQVIQNLVINADQAMPEGGKVRIGAENVIFREKEHVKLKPGKYVRIWIEDEGCGMAESQLSKIFDPFFTTKEKGRGLGLTTLFSIVDRHGGHVRVDSRVGMGSTFHIYLPATDERPLGEEEAGNRVFFGEGKVLLIDDDEYVLKSGGELLKRLGYDVTLAEDSGEGIRIYRQAMAAEEPFAAIITDLTMRGGMGGKEAVRVLLDIDPKAKVIVSSGYSDNPAIREYGEIGFVAAVPKPYGIRTLSETLHKVLSGDSE